MQLKTIQSIAKDLEDKRVLLRLDLNVPLKNGQVAKEGQERIIRSLPTIQYLQEQGAKIIIVAHLGRPEGKVVKKYSLKPVADVLAKMLKVKIELWDKEFSTYRQASQELDSGQIVMLENIRFQEREQKNCKRLAKKLSNLADIYVNDAFANIHRQDTSMYTITYFLPSYAGLLLQEEIKYLAKAQADDAGLVVLLGGAKVSTKIKLIKKFILSADNILIGGAIANTMLAAKGISVGKSVKDKDYLEIARQLLYRKVLLPVDVVVSSSLEGRRSRIVALDQIGPSDVIIDIGPQTVRKYLQILAKAKLIIWNGPMGYFENIHGRQASSNIMKVIAKYRAQTIIGGGETVELVNLLKLKNNFSFISTGGGAMLAFLQGDVLPSLNRLKANIK